MDMGPIVWACLALTVHQAPVKEFFMNGRNFEIPIKLDPQRAHEVKELILLVSKDKGGVWQPVDSKRPSERKFVYRAPADGSYWFIVQQVNHDGRTIPDDPERVKPSSIMGIIVDTAPPKVQVTAKRMDNGRIRAYWTIAETAPARRSLRLEYHTDALPPDSWTPVAADFALQGDKEFPVREDRPGEVRVRVRIKDQAGNEGQHVAVVAAAAASVVSTPALESSARPAERSAFRMIPSAQPDPLAQPNQLTSRATPRPNAPTVPGPPGDLPLAANPEPTPLPSASPMATASGGRQPPVKSQQGPVASRSPLAVKIVKVPEVRLDFTVAKVGPSGLGAADVYVTLDKGANWKKMPGEVPIRLEQEAERHGPGPVRGSVGVHLPKEGITYGFLVAVKSKAGLAPPPPKRGDPPQALVELDSTPPSAQMYKPQPDPSQPNTLILSWTAEDRNLAEKPITLEWAEQKGGPWNLIGENLIGENLIGENVQPNSRQYPWRLPEQLPPRVYLRLTVRDRAGNVARAQTDKPQLIDLSVPQTTIIGVAPNIPR